METTNLVEQWYDDHAEMEEHRLDEGRLEFEVTMRIIKSCLEKLEVDKLRVLDVGGGPGRYGIQPRALFYPIPTNDSTAIFLSKLGHRVILGDVSSQSLEIAKKNAVKESVQLEGIVRADARDLLVHPDLKESQGSFDIVLCLGPLYHILDQKERTWVLENCLHLVKAGGYVLVAYVSVYAHLRDLARRDPARLSKEWTFYSSYLDTGNYSRNPQTKSFHVYPGKLGEELKDVEGKVKVEKVVSCEGFLGFDGAKGLAELGVEERERWVDVIMHSAENPEVLGAADHLLVVLKKL